MCRPFESGQGHVAFSPYKPLKIRRIGEPSWLAAALGLALVLPFISVVIQSVRAAASDPARVLRNE